MSRARRRYDLQIKIEAVRMVMETGRPPAEVAAELAVDARAVRSWVRAARRAAPEDTAPFAAPETESQAESSTHNSSKRVQEMERHLLRLRLETQPPPYSNPPPDQIEQPSTRSSVSRGGRFREERLSALDWVDKALAVLMADGITAVKVPRLCAELNVTKGSFYWHFANLDELMRGVAERWADITRGAHNALTELEKLPPQQRLARMTALLVDTNYLTVERSIRNWARTDPLIAKTVTESDIHIHTLLRGALLDLGFDPEEARIRSAILVNAGIGFAQGGSPLPEPTPADIEKYYSIVVGIDITMPSAEDSGETL